MDPKLFILMVFTGVVPLVLPVSRRYYLSQEAKTWNDAQSYCKANYIDLAVISSDEDMIQFQSQAQNLNFSSSAWIGMFNDVNSWRWSLGNEPRGSMYKWISGQPNNNWGHQKCGVIIPTGWDDRGCAEKYPSVCFDGNNTGNDRYIYTSMALTWYDAQCYCRQHHTDLASTRDETEYSVVQGLASASAFYTWFGLFRDSWKWVDQTNFSTISWMPGSPNNALKNENCGYLSNYQADDAQCSEMKPFFCYALVTRKKQVMRMKIKPDQDVRTIMTAILEKEGEGRFRQSRKGRRRLRMEFSPLIGRDMGQSGSPGGPSVSPAVESGLIEQKLKDHGMAENIVMKWRVITK